MDKEDLFDILFAAIKAQKKSYNYCIENGFQGTPELDQLDQDMIVFTQVAFDALEKLDG